MTGPNQSIPSLPYPVCHTQVSLVLKGEASEHPSLPGPSGESLFCEGTELILYRQMSTIYSSVNYGLSTVWARSLQQVLVWGILPSGQHCQVLVEASWCPINLIGDLEVTPGSESLWKNIVFNQHLKYHILKILKYLRIAQVYLSRRLCF